MEEDEDTGRAGDLVGAGVGACEGRQEEAGEMTEDVEETEFSEDVDRPVGEIAEAGESHLVQVHGSEEAVVACGSLPSPGDAGRSATHGDDI